MNTCRRSTLLIASTLTLILGSCQAGRTLQTRSTADASGPYFPPDPPTYMHDPHERLDYLIKHYWDEFDWSDSTRLNHPEELEYVYAEYFGLLTSRSVKMDRKALLLPLERSQGRMLSFALSMYRKYFFEPNSPFVSDELYAPVLIWSMRSPKVPMADQEAARALLVLINKNKIGTIAKDFTYIKADTILQKLHPVRSPYTVLMFGTLGCNTCQMALSYFAQEPIYADMVRSKRLTMLHIFVQANGHNLDSLDTIPQFVDRGFDYEGRIMKHQIYDIKASPTLYLLGKGGRVLLKDAKLDEITEYLQKHK